MSIPTPGAVDEDDERANGEGRPAHDSSDDAVNDTYKRYGHDEIPS